MGKYTGAQKHTHKYERNDYGQWECSLPDCTHYLPKNIKRGSPEGKYCLCWKCGKQFILDAAAMERARPHCQECRLVAAGMSPDAIAEFMVQQELAQKRINEEKELAENKQEVIKKDKDGNEIEVFDPLA